MDEGEDFEEEDVTIVIPLERFVHRGGEEVTGGEGWFWCLVLFKEGYRPLKGLFDG